MRTESTRRDMLALFLIALAIRIITAILIPQPGYMDAAYYASGAITLAQGRGLSEPFIWNYLDDPAGVPRPGFLYWMPLPSLLAAPFAALIPESFFALQLPFALLSAALPVLAYAIAGEITYRRQVAWMAGLFTLFSGFFFPYWTLPETFTPFALAGTLALWLATKTHSTGVGRRFLAPLATGGLVGLAHLTRADGILLLPVVLIAPLFTLRQHQSTEDNPQFATRNPHLSFVICHLSFIILGYLLVMLPWFLRNISLTGAPLPPGGTRTLWLRVYDDLYCYRCDLSLQSYLAWGWRNILQSKLRAAWINVQRFWAEDGLIFLLPFMIGGLYLLRRRAVIILSIAFLSIIYLAHTFAFTFPGPRGGFFHASTALLPFLNTAGVVGLDAAIAWAARRRRWHAPQARKAFFAAAVLLALGLSLYTVSGKVMAWRSAYAPYRELDQWLTRNHATPADAAVMVTNPPSFWYVTRRPAVAVPNEGGDAVIDVATRYQIDYLVLDTNHPTSLETVYEGTLRPDYLDLLHTFGDLHIYRIDRP